MINIDDVRQSLHQASVVSRARLHVYTQYNLIPIYHVRTSK